MFMYYHENGECFLPMFNSFFSYLRRWNCSLISMAGRGKFVLYPPSFPAKSCNWDLWAGTKHISIYDVLGSVMSREHDLHISMWIQYQRNGGKIQTQKGTRTWLQDVMKSSHFCFHFLTKMLPWSDFMETSPLEEGGLGAWEGLQCEKETNRVTKMNFHVEIHITIKYLKRLVN